ncbi:MAG: hypothetical protein ACR2N2_06945 [Acidimicrobiia bacterium]
MPTWKIIGMAIAWAFAAGFIAVVTAILVAEVLRLVGIVDSGDGSYGVSLNIVFGVVFVALLAVPVVFRRRFAQKQPPPTS